MAKKSRGYLVMSIAGQKTVRELEKDHEECEGCGSRDKPVFTYLGQNDEPIVCSKRCFELALVRRFGGVRKPTKQQIRETEVARLERATKRLGHEPPNGNVVAMRGPIRRAG